MVKENTEMVSQTKRNIDLLNTKEIICDTNLLTIKENILNNKSKLNQIEEFKKKIDSKFVKEEKKAILLRVIITFLVLLTVPTIMAMIITKAPLIVLGISSLVFTLSSVICSSVSLHEYKKMVQGMKKEIDLQYTYEERISFEEKRYLKLENQISEIKSIIKILNHLLINLQQEGIIDEQLIKADFEEINEQAKKLEKSIKVSVF